MDISTSSAAAAVVPEQVPMDCNVFDTDANPTVRAACVKENFVEI